MAILAEQEPTFQPALRVIDSISQADPASITTTFAHNYVDNTILRLVIPPGFGMQQADGLTGTITVTSDTTFTISIDTTHFDAFSAAASFPESYQFAQCVPIGEKSATLSSATENVLPY